MKGITPVLIAAAFTSWVLGHFVCLSLQRAGIVDQPNDRSSHKKPTARGGGIGIIVTIAVTAAGITRLSAGLFLFVVLALTVLLAVVSFLDDLRSLPPGLRFGCHALAAVVVVGILADSAASFWAMAAFFSLAFLWIVGYTNAFNFMDGINGIAAGQALITGTGMGLLVGIATTEWSSPPVLLTFAVAGAAAGFLPFNFPSARMFMGDVGSAPLGFLLAALALWLAREHGWWLTIPLGLLHANFVLDTGITLVRRILRRERWYEAHREHFYQRLIRSGKSHACVTGWEMALQVVVLVAALLYLRADNAWRVAISAAVVGIWLAFFVFCEREFQKVKRSGAFMACASD